MNGPPFKIAFITDGEPFHGASPEERALGGSETALVQISRKLAKLGHKVKVFCRCPAPGDYHGVSYEDRRGLVAAALEQRFEILIVSRFFTAFDLPIQAGLKVLWNHDILDKPRLMAERLDQIDLAFVLSDYHAQNYIERLPACQSRLVQTRNGLDLELMDRGAAGVVKSPVRVTYVSRPERGLKQLLEYIWPRLKRQIPQLELKICGYQVELTDLHPALQAEYAKIDRLLEQSEGVEHLGPLPKEGYYTHLASCQALLYPCTFPEISCISALEAQALGTAIITSDEFALKQTVQEPLFKVPGVPGSPQYLEAYTNRALQILGEPHKYADATARAKSQVRRDYSWERIAAEWADLFEQKLEERLKAKPLAVSAGLLIKGDTQAAAAIPGIELSLPKDDGIGQDPDETGLNQEISSLILERLSLDQLDIGLVSPLIPRDLPAMQMALPGAVIKGLSPMLPSDYKPELLIIKDLLERSPAPDDFLAWALDQTAANGWLLLCLAGGAWPLSRAGFINRCHDLGPDEINLMLPGRELFKRHLPRGLIKSGKHQYPLGRWLIMVRAGGALPESLDCRYKYRQVRPSPPEVVNSLIQAGILKDGSSE
jgi:glycosyltransferase involved in cell wall biosynthesis